MTESKTGIVFITALITALLTSAVWVGIGAVIYWYGVSEPPPFVVEIESPRNVSKGETVSLVIDVSNPTSEALELGSIDIYDTLIEGFAVVSVEPKPDSIDDNPGFASFYYSQSLSPGASFTANLTLRAEETGVWTGDIDCCTPLEQFVTTTHTILVNDPSSAPDGAEAE